MPTPEIKPRRNFGWLPQLPDQRDMPYRASLRTYAAGLPAKVDLSASGYLPAAYDQGQIGSCVANATAAAIEYAMRRRVNDPQVPDFLERDRIFTPSRLFIYYGAREYLGTVNEDSGCMIRDAMKVVYNAGAPRESGWKYIESRFTKKPSKTVYKSAPYHKITSYRAVPVNVNAIRAALAEGLPVIFGVAVFNSFFERWDGFIRMPGANEPLLGGHAMLLVGYDDATMRFKFLNSWGEEWGQDGYGTIPYGYVGNPSLGSDYWVLTDELYKERYE